MAQVNLDVAMESTSQEILAKLGEGQNVTAQCVKSVQRQYQTSSSTSSTVTFTINAVDPNKSVVLVNGSVNTGDDAPDFVLNTFTSTSISLSNRLNGVWAVSIQVIEFY